MIEHTTINGRGATVAYLSYDFEPMDRTTAPMAKIIYDDGGVVFVKRNPLQARIAKLKAALGRE